MVEGEVVFGEPKEGSKGEKLVSVIGLDDHIQI